MKIIDKYNSMNVQTKAACWFLLCSFMQKGISTITTPIFTRIMSAAEYGQYNVFNSWMSIVNIFVTLMLTGGVYAQGLVKFEKEREIFSSSLQGLTLTMTFVWTIIYLLFHEFFNQLFSLTTVQCLAMIVMIWTTAVYNFWASEQRVKYSYKRLVILSIVVSIAKPFLGVLLVTWADDKVTARILGLVLVELIAYIGLFAEQMKRGKIFFSQKFWKYAFYFNIPLIPHYLSQAVLNAADRIMIKQLVGARESGIYSLAYSIASIMIVFNTALVNTVSPWIYQSIKKKQLSDISAVAYGLLGIVASANCMLIALAPEIVKVFAPESYYEAIYVIPPIAMGIYFMFAYDIFAKFQFYYEKTMFIMLASVLSSVINIVLNNIFIPAYGYHAAGYTTLVCYGIYTLAHYFCMKVVCKEYLEGYKVFSEKKLLVITGSFLGIGFGLLFAYDYPIVRCLLMVLAMVVVKKKKVFNTLKIVLEGKQK